jgi:hypothetical protein
VILTGMTMIVEIIAGHWTGSMALEVHPCDDPDCPLLQQGMA